MKTPVIKLPGLTIDCSTLRSVFASDGYSPQWSGKVVLTFDDSIDGMQTVVTANWQDKENAREGLLLDFEGDSKANDPIYAACEVYAADWSKEIASSLPRPSAFDAHANDLADPTFAQRHEPKTA